jgi:hypothetical protein
MRIHQPPLRRRGHQSASPCQHPRPHTLQHPYPLSHWPKLAALATVLWLVSVAPAVTDAQTEEAAEAVSAPPPTATAPPTEAQQPDAHESPNPKPTTSDPTEEQRPQKIDLSELRRLSDEHEIWIDMQRKRVIVGGEVCLTRGQLEMFACPKGTKEHESIVSLHALAYQIHAGLLAIGLEPGQTVRYQPEYRPASGPRVAIAVQWQDAQGQPQQVAAQQWIRQIKTGQAMEHDWVFAGSGFWKDDNTGKQWYLAEGGEAICVSNFGTALLDLPIASSQDNASLMFEAFTERLPPRGTAVKLILSAKEEAAK